MTIVASGCNLLFAFAFVATCMLSGEFEEEGLSIMRRKLQAIDRSVIYIISVPK